MFILNFPKNRLQSIIINKLKHMTNQKGLGKYCKLNFQCNFLHGCTHIQFVSWGLICFVQLLCAQVEVKPYVLDDQLCDECQGARCGGKFAPFFCANVTCLQYYCEFCWANIHSRAGREFHKPLVKEGADRPRQIDPLPLELEMPPQSATVTR